MQVEIALSSGACIYPDPRLEELYASFVRVLQAHAGQRDLKLIFLPLPFGLTGDAEGLT